MVIITLGGRDYRVPKLTIGQLRRLFTAETPQGQFGFDLIAIALERAEPRPAGTIDDIELDIAEFRAATQTLIAFFGLTSAGEAKAGAA